MSTDLLERVQQNMGYPELQKIDSNTQLIVLDENIPDEGKFGQAAIPAILSGLYKYVQSDEGAAGFLQSDNSTNWIKNIFRENKNDAIQTISDYSKQSEEITIVKLNAIVTEAVKITKENLPADATIKDVKAFLNSQINNILLYLPPALNMGELLHDNTLDDETNKMEGPVSGLIRSVGTVFSGSDTGNENHGVKPDMGAKMEQNY